jgi:TRAP-type C4-dicarboxylate transport system permease small subunit
VLRRLASAGFDVQIERWLGAILLLAIFGVMLTGVVLRYGFSISITWYEEFGRYGLIVMTMLGIGAGFKNRSHIVIDNSYLPGGVRWTADVLAFLVSFAFLIFLAWYGYGLASALHVSRSPALQIPASWLYLSLSALAAVGVLRLLEQAVRSRRGG